LKFFGKKVGEDANYALRVKPAMARGYVFLKSAEFAEFAVKKDFHPELNSGSTFNFQLKTVTK